MERKIGETFNFGWVTLEVVENEYPSCAGCCFNNLKIDCGFNMMLKDVGPCNSCFMEDGKRVIFKKVK